MKRQEAKRFRNLADIELIDLLHSMGDGLPREVVDEVLDRGQRMIPYLYVIVSTKHAWTRPIPEWWATVHASYILGAFETPETLPALLSALRWSDAFDCEWVTEDLPSMFGKLGQVAYGPLQAVVKDLPAGWGARSIALSSMAAVAMKAEFLKPQFLDYAAAILSDHTEPVPLRQAAANILMDFRSYRHKKLLVDFGAEESGRKEEIPDYEGVFYDFEVEEFLTNDDHLADQEYYQRDWMMFYDVEERERRRDFWEEEQLHFARSVEEQGVFKAGFDKLSGSSQCPCGSGKKYSDCCVKKLH